MGTLCTRLQWRRLCGRLVDAASPHLDLHQLIAQEAQARRCLRRLQSRQRMGAEATSRGCNSTLT